METSAEARRIGVLDARLVETRAAPEVASFISPSTGEDFDGVERLAGQVVKATP